MTQQQIDAYLNTRLYSGGDASFTNQFYSGKAAYEAAGLPYSFLWVAWIVRRQHRTGEIVAAGQVYRAWDEYTEYDITSAYTAGDPYMSQYAKRGITQVVPAENGLNIHLPGGAVDFVPDSEICEIYLTRFEEGKARPYPAKITYTHGYIK